jgi:hypothetical protein
VEIGIGGSPSLFDETFDYIVIKADGEAHREKCRPTSIVRGPSYGVPPSERIEKGVAADICRADESSRANVQNPIAERASLMRILRRAGYVGVALIALLMLAPIAVSAGSDRVVVTRNTLDITTIDLTTCDFPLEIRERGKEVVHEFFDKEGNPTKIIFTFPGFKVTMTNLDTGESLTFPAPASFTLDFVNGTFTATGNQGVVTVPHLGLVFQDAGRIVYSFGEPDPIFVAGNHDFFLGGEDMFQPFCEALSG